MHTNQPNPSNEPNPNPPTSLGIDQTLATRLIRLGLASQGRPIDDVIARLERADGEVWFEHSLAIAPLNAVTRAPIATIPLETIRNAKEAAKHLLRHPVDANERLLGVLAYFVCVGVALVQHNQLICGRGNAEVQSVLADLATAVPLNWSGLLAKASRAA